jgi:hypothetical protein
MRYSIPLTASALILATAATAWAAETTCEAGAYGAADQNIVVLERKDWIPSPGFGYLMLDGRYGSTLSPDSPIRCGAGHLLLKTENSEAVRLDKRDFKRTREDIPVAGATLVGDLLEKRSLRSAITAPTCWRHKALRFSPTTNAAPGNPAGFTRRISSCWLTMPPQR